jgi:hypothetical protein
MPVVLKAGIGALAYIIAGLATAFIHIKMDKEWNVNDGEDVDTLVLIVFLWPVGVLFIVRELVERSIKAMLEDR